MHGLNLAVTVEGAVSRWEGQGLAEHRERSDAPTPVNSCPIFRCDPFHFVSFSFLHLHFISFFDNASSAVIFRLRLSFLSDRIHFHHRSRSHRTVYFCCRPIRLQFESVSTQICQLQHILNFSFVCRSRLESDTESEPGLNQKKKHDFRVRQNFPPKLATAVNPEHPGATGAPICELAAVPWGYAGCGCSQRGEPVGAR